MPSGATTSESSGLGIGRQPDHERRSDARLGLQGELPSLGLDQLTSDRQAQPVGGVGIGGAITASVALVAALPVPLEDEGLLGRFDARPLVADRDPRPPAALTAADGDRRPARARGAPRSRAGCRLRPGTPHGRPPRASAPRCDDVDAQASSRSRAPRARSPRHAPPWRGRSRCPRLAARADRARRGRRRCGPCDRSRGELPRPGSRSHPRAPDRSTPARGSSSRRQAACAARARPRAAARAARRGARRDGRACGRPRSRAGRARRHGCRDRRARSSRVPSTRSTTSATCVDRSKDLARDEPRQPRRGNERHRAIAVSIHRRPSRRARSAAAVESCEVICTRASRSPTCSTRVTVTGSGL